MDWRSEQHLMPKNPDDNTIQTRLSSILKKIEGKTLACGRPPESVNLVAVSKKKTIQDIREAASAGARIFGENYIQEAIEKSGELQNLDLMFHFIGHLQSNKAKYAVKIFDLIHSVDSFNLAIELDKQAKKISKIQNILIQVNISMEETKSGIPESGVLELVKQISKLENISIHGLMTMPPFYDDPENARPYFRTLRCIRDNIKKLLPQLTLNELSMGMTGDYEVAIEEGATLVRIGTAIFGERQ